MAQYRELEAFSKFSSDMDAVTAMTIDRGRKNNQLLIQPQYSPMPVGEQVAIIYCGTRGLMHDVRYWMNEKKIELERLLVVVDDLALPFGSLRMKPGGSEAGHNGLRHITQVLGTQQYARLRFGIGNDFPRGGQIDYVLGNLSPEDEAALPEQLDVAAEMIKSFALSGIQFTMNHFNKR